MSTPRWLVAVGAVAILVAMAVASGALKGRAVTSASAQARLVTSSLMSPYCPELLLTDCPSPRAADLRNEVAQRLAQGETTDAVRNDLIRRFGREIAGSPEPEGFGLLVWIVPGFVGAILSAVLLGLARRTMNQAAGRTAATEPPVPASASLLARLDEELAEMD